MLLRTLARARAFVRSRNPRHRHGDLELVRQYWREPDADNRPELYLGNGGDVAKRSRFLVSWVESCGSRDSKIFELGCNVGRNLSYLYEEGYRNLHGLEMNKEAVTLFHRHFPEAAAASIVQCNAVEEWIRTVPDQSYDISFTMAVLEHIHTDSEWVFGQLARVTRTWLLTIEDELSWSWRHFPRNYKKIFEAFEFQEVKQLRLNVKEHGLGSGFCARLFERE